MLANNKTPDKPDTSAGALRRVSLWFAAIALLGLVIADISITTLDPWTELRLMVAGALSPSVWSWSTLASSLANTFAFALQGVTLGGHRRFFPGTGLPLSHWYAPSAAFHSLDP